MTISSPYNKDQIKALTQYGLANGVERFALHAYVSTQDIKDEEGYTKAHNADVARLEVAPAHIAQGIDQLLLDNPGTDVTISSRVVIKGGLGHIPMLDMKIPYIHGLHTNDIPILNVDVDRFLKRTGLGDEVFGPAKVYVSGHSYHLYGLDSPPMREEDFAKFVSAVLVCDHDLIADHAWLGFSLQRGEFRLRLTAVQAKYVMIPTESWKTSTLQALRNQAEIAVFPEEVPF